MWFLLEKQTSAFIVYFGGCGFLEVRGSYSPLCCNTLHLFLFGSGTVSKRNVVGKDVFARNAGGKGNVGTKLSQDPAPEYVSLILC